MGNTNVLIMFFFVVKISAQVGIGTTNPQGTLHIYETTGTAATPNNASLVLEHGNAGGESSIIFKSNSNAGSDYGYIKFQDNAAGAGASSENGLLTIGIENDVSGFYQDDINIAPSGSLGINNTAPHGSASIDLGSTNKGILINRVALSGTTDTSTISNPAVGLQVYNTATTADVIPGFYFFNGSIWEKFGIANMTVSYNQTNEIIANANNTIYVDIPGLDQNFTAPYTGTYQFVVNGYYATGNPTNPTVTVTTSSNVSHTHTVVQRQDGASQGSIRLTINGTSVGEKYITSISKSFTGQTFYSLGQNATIVSNVYLVSGTTYNLKVQGREWARYNCSEGYFGRTTSIYSGANGVGDAQYAKMVVTFIGE